MTTPNERTAIINDRYEIFKRIGRGGMADVFLGRDRLLDRQVAIKVLFPEFAKDPNFVERFRREAQAAANLSHPNIVNVYDWGKHSGTYFIAMEYVHGRTLADILRSNGHVTSKQAAEIASEVAAALGFAHEAGLVHRDIKPANILIGSNGAVKVADFGIARAMNSTAESNLTQAGAVMGTATYFSPEQAQGAQPDPRSDLYSLGVVMYEMVAGRPPFTGDNPVSIAYKQVHDHPQPLNQLVADVPRAYEAIVARLLTKDPRVRYPTASALRDDLRRFRSGEPVQALAGAAARTSSAAAAAATAAQTVPMRPVPTGQQTVRQQAVQPTGSHRPTGASTAARYYEPPPSRTGWYALAAFFALIALGIGALLLFNALSGDDEPGSRTLGNYVGQPFSVVTRELQELGLPFSPMPEENTSVGEDVVWKTDPVAGTVVVDNQLIKVFYNPTKEMRQVPNVVDRPLADAKAAIAAAGFPLGDESTEESTSVAAGSVIRTDPPAGQAVRIDTPINFTISAGPRQLAVPSQVIGMTEPDARALLTGDDYGFRVTVVTEESANVAEGLVIRTNPGVNQLVDVGGLVTLVISSGSPGVTIPNVVGETEAAARAQLGQFEVAITVRDLPAGDSNDGRVLSQSPIAGAIAPPGTRITLEIGRAAAPTTTAAPPAPTTTRPPPPAPTTTTAPPPAPTTTAAAPPTT